MITLSRNYIGSSHHLEFDGEKYSWSREVNGLLWEENSALFQVVQLYGLEVPEVIPAKYVTMAKFLNCVQQPQYIRMAGPGISRDIKQALSLLCSHVEKLKNDPYFDTFLETHQFFDLLKPAKISVSDYESLKLSKGLPAGFENVNGCIPKPLYSRSNSKTGRMTIVDGPNVLTLKKEYRTIISGCRQIDYSSMEPRLLLEISGKKVDGDLYEWIKNKIGKGMTRARAKIAILTSLYGNNTHKEIEKIFEVKSWVSKLKSQVDSDGFIRNYFGRPINVEGVTGNKLLALWLQSSAVDAAIMGFLNFFKDNPQFVPHWVIHDACIFSGKGDLPHELKITEDIYLPIVCTGVSNETN